ncbi:hypothetical protein [Sphingobium chungbukense]|uniref:Uncharacterized protein n=1 Tax=Sphingobium chungbukense TaxID=56193 RepID=A0A0M3AWI2_9SPHN|nr:hypothetical protein [Sphingobium chungbukense]KKW92944.1 hypothetical protein YP76_08650 [Sphingobium chungbukense]
MASKAPRSAPIPRVTRRRRLRRDKRQPQPVPTLAALLTVIPSLSRAELGRLVQRMIDHMDQMDGDPDLEQEGMEDDWVRHKADGPGCPISDPGGGNVEDEGQINEVAPYTGPIAVSTARTAAERGESKAQ